MEFWILGILLIFSLALRIPFFFKIFVYPFLYECLVSKKMGQKKEKKYECNLRLVAEKVKEKPIK